MTLTRRILAAVAAAAAVLAAAPQGARAQARTPAAGTPPAFGPLQSIAVNPLAIPFGLFSFEYEASLPTPGFTLGAGGSYWSNDGDRDSWIEAKAMYYPNETQFRGFSIGLTAGVHSARNSGCNDLFGSCGGTDRHTQTAPTLGVIGSYDWLLGRAERFRVGLGVGAKRVLKDVDSHDPLSQVYPDGRFVIGVVF